MMDLKNSIIGILDVEKQIIGTGFFVSQKTVLTCAHVIKAAKVEPGGSITVRLALDGSDILARVDPEFWSPAQEHDIALLRVDQAPENAEHLPLGASSGTSGHEFYTYGYATVGGVQGLGARGEIIDVVEQGDLLQITSQEIDRGFSGAPVWDESRRAVVGMITWGKISMITQRHRDTTFAVTSDTIRDIVPELEYSEVCPYRSLDAFTEDDAELFFGRERVVERLLDSLKQEPRFLAVLGPSGSGKSSVVKAGLIPALKGGKMPGSQKWGILTLRPGSQPFDQLVSVGLENPAGGLVDSISGWLASHPEHTRFFLVIDQFEELLVNVPESVRQDFITQLGDLLDAPLELSLVLVMRDDFYSRFQQMAAPLVTWLERGLVNIPPELSKEELREIIVSPAESLGLVLEEGLEDAVIADAVETGGSARSTVLPLLEFTLTQLWEMRVDGRLLHDAYRSLGGVSGGLSQWADRTYNSFSMQDRLLARRILTDLVRVGEPAQELPDSKRRRAISELSRRPDERESTVRVARTLADARLLSTGRDEGVESAELIHEALLREWRQLRNWLDDDRHFLAWRQKLEERHWNWKEGKGELLRGRELAEAQGFWAERSDDLQDEQEYILASLRQASRLRWLVAGSVALAFLVIGAAGLLAWGQRNQAQAASTQAISQQGTAQAASTLAFGEATKSAAAQEVAEQQARIALARQLAVQSEAQRDLDPSLAFLLALESYKAADTYESRNVLLGSLTLSPRLLRILYSHENAISSIAVSPDGNLIASGSCGEFSYGIEISICLQGEIRIWDAKSGELLTVLEGHNEGSFSYVRDLAFSPDGKFLASGAGDATIIIWDTTTWKSIGEPLRGHTQDVIGLGFDPTGKKLLSASWDGTVVEWDFVKLQETGRTIDVLKQINSMAISSNGKYIALGSKDGSILIWDWASFQPSQDSFQAHQGSISSLTFNPGGNWLASSSLDGDIKLWSFTEEGGVDEKTLPLESDRIAIFLRFDPDGSMLVAGADNGSIYLYHDPLSDSLSIETITGHTDKVNTFAFSPDGHRLYSGAGEAEDFNQDNRLLIWDMVGDLGIIKRLDESGEGISNILFSPDSDLLVTTRTNGKVELRDAEDPAQSQLIDALRGYSRSVAFSPDGSLLAAVNQSGEIQLLDFIGKKKIGNPFGENGEEINELLFSPDGNTLYATVLYESTKNKIYSWSIADQRPAADPIEAPFDMLSGIKIGPDGRYLAIGGTSEAQIWDLNLGTQFQKFDLSVLPGVITSTTFSPDLGIVAAVGSVDRRVSVKYTDDGNHLVGSPIALDYFTGAAEFSPDLNILAISGLRVGNDPVFISLWDMSAGAFLGYPFSLTSTPEIISSIAFRPDGKAFAAADLNGNLLILDLEPAAWQEHACDIVGRNLTRAEWEQFLPDEGYRGSCPQWPAGE